MYKKNELPINLDIEFTESMGVCIPLCILSTEKNYDNWLNTHYMMPVACMKDDDSFMYIIADDVSYGWMSNIPSSLLKFSFIGEVFLKTNKDIIGLIVERIDSDWYCGLFLDNYYLPSEWSYQKYHFAHEILIYGYDMETGIFQAVTFGRKFHKVEISFEDLKEGYVAAFTYIKEREGWDEYMLMQFSLIGHSKEYFFNKVEFVRKFMLYSEGKLPQEVYFEKYLYANFDEGECYYGINANNAMLLKMKKVQQMFCEGDEKDKYDIFRQYGPIHTYMEYHRALYRRLVYYNSKVRIGDNGNTLIKKYHEIVDVCEAIRLLYIKLKLFSKRRDDEKIIKTLKNIVDKFEYITLYEPEIINSLSDIICN